MPAGVDATADAPAPMKPRLFAFDSNSWFSNWMNRQHILSRLGARGWPVVYSSGPMSVSEVRALGLRQCPWRWRTRVDHHVTVPLASGLLATSTSWSRWNALAYGIHAHRLRAVLPASRPGHDIAMVFNPDYFPQLASLKPRHVVFHVRDAYRELPGWNSRNEAHFLALQQRADLITLSSQKLLDELQTDVQFKARVLLNGADVDNVALCMNDPCPADLAAIGHPRLGYVGVISQKVDLELIGALARRQTTWQWVFVGPIPGGDTERMGGSHAAYAAWTHLLALPNVHWLGAKSHTEVGRYMVHMDVNTMPYVVDQRAGGWARFAYPLKLHEYLAAGLPVVSADMVDVQRHSDVLEFAEGIDGWEAALARAVAGDTPGNAAARRAVAKLNSWDSRVDDLESWLLTLAERP